MVADSKLLHIIVHSNCVPNPRQQMVAIGVINGSAKVERCKQLLWSWFQLGGEPMPQRWHRLIEILKKGGHAKLATEIKEARQVNAFNKTLMLVARDGQVSESTNQIAAMLGVRLPNTGETWSSVTVLQHWAKRPGITLERLQEVLQNNGFDTAAGMFCLKFPLISIIFFLLLN